MVNNPEPTRPMNRVLAERNFRLLAAGAGTSLLGDQLTLVATPWLVLQLTSDPLMLGLVLALQGIPRAVLMIVGGAITDRVSAHRVMLVAALVRGAITGALALAVLSAAVQLWMVFAASALFGVVAGFAVPAENSIVPQVVRGADDLQAGNSVMMGLTQLAGLVGPALAGILVGHATHSLTGVGLALGLDTATFVVCVIALLLMRGLPAPVREAAAERVLAATVTGIRHLWRDRVLRTMFGILLAVNLLLMGPLMVGIPQLAHQRLTEGAAAFGLLMSAFALGNLAGYLVAGAMPRPDGAGLRRIVIALVAAFGIGIGGLGVVPWTWVDAAALTLLGLGNGFMAVILVTWMQARTPPVMVGRMMGLMMLASTGLTPVSEAAAGLIGRFDLTLLFVIPGGLVCAMSLGLTVVPSLRDLGEELAREPAGAGAAPVHPVAA